MMKKNLIFWAFTTLALASCNNGFKKGEGGLLYNIRVDNHGQKIQEGDFVSVNLLIKTDGDSVLLSTKQMGHPILKFLPKSLHKGDFNGALLLLSEGDSATMRTNIDSINIGGHRPSYKGTYTNYEVKVLKVIPKAGLSEQEFNNRIISYKKQQSEILSKAEPIAIKQYIDANKLNVTKTPSGLFYVINKTGSGDKPVAGDTVEINFIAKKIDGKIISTNIRDTANKYNIFNPLASYRPMRFTLGVHGLVPASWNEGALLLTKGAIGIFIAKSKLAYADNMDEDLSSYIPLVFQLELVNIIHPNLSAQKRTADAFRPHK